ALPSCWKDRLPYEECVRPAWSSHDTAVAAQRATVCNPTNDRADEYLFRQLSLAGAERALSPIGVAAVVTEGLTIRAAARRPGPRHERAVAGHVGRIRGVGIAGEKFEDANLISAGAGAGIVHDIGFVVADGVAPGDAHLRRSRPRKAGV